MDGEKKKIRVGMSGQGPVDIALVKEPRIASGKRSSSSW